MSEYRIIFWSARRCFPMQIVYHKFIGNELNIYLRAMLDQGFSIDVELL